MALLNQFLCANLFGNTGFGQCSLIPKEIKGFFIVPRDFVITQEMADAIQSELQDAAFDDSPLSRIFPVHGLVGITDNSEEPVTETLGYGAPVTLRPGNYSWTFRFIDGGICLLRNLQRFNGQPVNVIFYDSDGVLFGRQLPDGLGGVPMIDFNANKWTPSDGSTLAGFNVALTFDPVHLNQNLAFLKDDDFDPSTIYGLQDLSIAISDSGASNLQVKVSTFCNGDDVFPLYSAQLSDPSVWNILGENGEVLDITGVAANPGAQAWDITMDDPLPSSVTISLGPVSALVTAGVEGYEGRMTHVNL